VSEAKTRKERTAQRIEGELIRENGTVEGCLIETYHFPLEYVRYTKGDDGYVSIVADGPGYNWETRIAATHVVRLARTLVEATPELEALAAPPTKGR
jgi:hypothetical protein